jgi:hypothetical protein
LKGSNKNERSKNTTAMTGNSPAVQSSHQGWRSSLRWVSSTSKSTFSMPRRSSSARRCAAVLATACAARRRRGRK